MVRRALLYLLLTASALAAQVCGHWPEDVTQAVAQHDLRRATQAVECRLQQSSTDTDALFWRARLLVWTGELTSAAQQYRDLLKLSPKDVDILLGYADVLLRLDQPQEALAVVDQAIRLDPSRVDVLNHRARLLKALGDSRSAARDYRASLSLLTDNPDASNGLASLQEETRHKLLVGVDVDYFNYTDAAVTESLSLASRWNARWATNFSASTYQRFGADAMRGVASVTRTFHGSTWITATGGLGKDAGVVSKGELAGEIGHGIRLSHTLFRGLELSFQQRRLWFQGVSVFATTAVQVIYFPKDLRLTLTTVGSRTAASGGMAEWQPSGCARLNFPLPRRLSGNVLFGLGASNFVNLEQIGHFSAHSYGGGLAFRVNSRQEVSGYAVYQIRSGGRTQTTVGMAYAFRF